MPNRNESKADWNRQTSKSTVSSVASGNEGSSSGKVWALRIPLILLLIVLIMPIALLITPWWIYMQPCEGACPTMMSGYYRIASWPMTLSKKIRSYQDSDTFAERLSFWKENEKGAEQLIIRKRSRFVGNAIRPNRGILVCTGRSNVELRHLRIRNDCCFGGLEWWRNWPHIASPPRPIYCEEWSCSLAIQNHSSPDAIVHRKRDIDGLRRQVELGSREISTLTFDGRNKFSTFEIFTDA